MADLSETIPDSAETADSSGNRQRLLVVSPPSGRAVRKEGRPVTSLAAVFGRFAEIQNLVGDQVVALEDSVQQQDRQLAEVSAQLPDMKQRINWLIASYYEDVLESQSIRERLARQEAEIASLTEAVRGLCEAQAQWRQTVDQLLRMLRGEQSGSLPGE